MVLAKKSLFDGVEPEIGTPKVNAITSLKIFVLSFLLATSRYQQCQQEEYCKKSLTSQFLQKFRQLI